MAVLRCMIGGLVMLVVGERENDGERKRREGKIFLGKDLNTARRAAFTCFHMRGGEK